MCNKFCFTKGRSATQIFITFALVFNSQISFANLSAQPAINSGRSTKINIDKNSSNLDTAKCARLSEQHNEISNRLEIAQRMEEVDLSNLNSLKTKLNITKTLIVIGTGIYLTNTIAFQLARASASNLSSWTVVDAFKEGNLYRILSLSITNPFNTLVTFAQEGYIVGNTLASASAFAQGSVLLTSLVADLAIQYQVVKAAFLVITEDEYIALSKPEQLALLKKAIAINTAPTSQSEQMKIENNLEYPTGRQAFIELRNSLNNLDTARNKILNMKNESFLTREMGKGSLTFYSALAELSTMRVNALVFAQKTHEHELKNSNCP